MSADTTTFVPRSDEAQAVFDHRFREARDAGLTLVEARMFAETPECDVGLLRKCVAAGWKGAQIAEVIL